jgi:competence protein ComEC
MTQSSSVIICLAYILGLLYAAFPWGGVGILVVAVVGAVYSKISYYLTRHKPTSKRVAAITKTKSVPYARIWLIAGLVGVLATLYFHLRVPQPGENDISKFIVPADSTSQDELVIVRGKIATRPRLTPSQQGQFWLVANQLDTVKSDKGSVASPQGVTGKVYVTVPILQSTGLYPGELIAVTGYLYKPKTAVNPGSFNFQQFLQQEGTFAGLKGRQVDVLEEERQWGWWQIREQIVRMQVRQLGIPEGPLVSAMVLGSKAVDLPFDIRNLFVKFGLAHTFAATGFQTSLILGVILTLTKNATKTLQITFSLLALTIFLILTGFEPAVVRSVIMSFGALVGLYMKRKVNQLGPLLLATTVLLLFNPLWIWDLGFQLSFLATVGLIVTASVFDKMPPLSTSLITVPLVATIWTLPLTLKVFSVIPIYSLLLNILSTPLISLIIIGGIFSASVSLIFPDGGSTLTGLLYYPTHLLIQLAELPTNSSDGGISLWQMVTIYALMILVWLVQWWQQRWWIAGIISITLVVAPLWYPVNNLLQITVLAAGIEPVLVIQDRGTVTLINSGDENTGNWKILPFLKQQGINKIDWAIASEFPGNDGDAWMEILEELPIKNFYDYAPKLDNSIETQAIQQQLQKHQSVYQPLVTGGTVNTGPVLAQLINDQIPILKLKIFDQDWLLVGNVSSQEIAPIIKSGILPPSKVIWCFPDALNSLVLALEPQVAIVANDFDNRNLPQLSQNRTKLLFIGRDGAVQWTPNREFETFIQTTESKSSVL